MKKQKYSEQVLDWCNEFENEIFLSPTIQTYKVHQLANDYIKLRNQFENKKYFLTEIKREIFKKISSLDFFEGNEKLLKEEIDGLFSAEFSYNNIESALSPFKKDIIKSLYKNDTVTEIHPQESNLLYDLGLADWNYIKSHFTHKINDSYLHEAVSWIVSFIKSEDYIPEEIIIKNPDGKISKDETFLNILKTINEKAVANKPPFDINKGKIFYNKISNTSVDIKLWHEKEQRFYGGLATRMRDFSDAYKSLDAFYHLASENAIIKEMKSQREESVVSSERVNQLVRMKLYNEVKNSFKERAERGMPDYKSFEFFTKLDENLLIVKGALNNSVFFQNEKQISEEEIKSVLEEMNMKNSCLFYGDLLNKASSNKSLFAGMFLNGFNDSLSGKNYINLSNNAVDKVVDNINIEFSGYKKTGNESFEVKNFMYRFLIKNKKDIKDSTNLMSEKSVYKEERELLFTNFKKCFEEITEKGLEDGVYNYFKDLDVSQKNELISVFNDKDFYRVFKDKLDEIKVSQHESSIIKNVVMEKAFGILIGQNPSAVGGYIKNKEEKGISSEAFEEIQEWKKRFVEDVLLSQENDALSEVIMDEFFVLRNKYSAFNFEDLLRESLLDDESVLKFLPEKGVREEFLKSIFSNKTKEISIKESVESLTKEIPFNIKVTSGFLNNEEKITRWGFISSYFDNKTKKSTIKEANGWVVGFLKNGDFSYYKFSKTKNLKDVFPEILSQINKYSLTEKEPFVFKEGEIHFQEAGAGEVDVEFWDSKQKKINGMSITRHQGVEIEGNQFIRHPLKLFVKSIILQKKGAFNNEDTIKNTPIHTSDISALINEKLIKEKVLSDIQNGDEFAKNLSISREFIREKYGVNYHSSGYVISENEMKLLINEMNKTINYSFYGEIRNKSTFPELNAGLTNIAYVENIKNVGNFKLSIKASEMFMGNLNKYYNGVNEKADVDNTSKKILFNLFRKSSINESVIEYFSEPNSHRDERETLIQSIGVFLDKVKEEYDFCNDATLRDTINDFFGDAITFEEKEDFLVDFKNSEFSHALSDNLSMLKVSYGESKKRYNLLNEKINNMDKLLSLSLSSDIECAPCFDEPEKRSKLRISN